MAVVVPLGGARRPGFLWLDAHCRATCAAAHPDPTRLDREAGASAPGAAVESYEAAGGSRVGFCWPCGSKFKMRANSGARNVMVGSRLRLYLVRRRSARGPAGAQAGSRARPAGVRPGPGDVIRRPAPRPAASGRGPASGSGRPATSAWGPAWSGGAAPRPAGSVDVWEPGSC